MVTFGVFRNQKVALWGAGNIFLSGYWFHACVHLIKIYQMINQVYILDVGSTLIKMI